MPVIERCARHPETHTDRCYCGHPATAHVFYGSGCGHVCDTHADAITRRKPYAKTQPLARAHRVGRRPWRRCSSCLGICHWHDTAWVCDACGDEWDEDHDARFAPPSERPITGVTEP